MDETNTDAGLDELTSDFLGPAADTVAETNTAATDEQTSTGIEEPAQAAPVAPESATTQVAPAPAETTAPTTPTPAAPEVITLDLNDGRGPRQFTKEQLAQTLRQFPHIQKLYTEAKQRAEAVQPAAPRGPSPKETLSHIRASFDPAVQEAVEQGFVEPDLAALYPNFMASAMLVRDSLSAANYAIREQGAKIAWYEQQSQIRELRGNIDNNMQTLAQAGPAFQPLSDPQARAEFFQFLVATNAPIELVLNDRDYLISQWVGFRKSQFLGNADTQRTAAAQVAAQRATAKRRAQGAPLPGSRPAAAAPAPVDALSEMVEDFFNR